MDQTTAQGVVVAMEAALGWLERLGVAHRAAARSRPTQGRSRSVSGASSLGRRRASRTSTISTSPRSVSTHAR